MTKRKDDDLWTGATGGLEDFFDAARAEAPLPSGDFMARIEAQALAAQPAPTAPKSAPGLLRQVLETIGGWPGMAGLATACAVGVWMGVSPPASISPYIGTDAAEIDSFGVDPLSGFELALMEG
ncbi:hypothetical protein [Pacificoceanicola onchidii]|uniref:hypothetical protein n=1 Tax=Pacificoceanicola onchidii TaxID=2562685 RepID=UPI0010A47F4D|nr:hypothetical protein [Pacificoceanicola onchidii]